MKLSINQKTILIVISSTIAVFILIVSFLYKDLHSSFRKKLDNATDSTINRLSESVKEPLWNINKGLVDIIVKSEMNNDFVDAIVVDDFSNNSYSLFTGFSKNDTNQIISIDNATSLLESYKENTIFKDDRKIGKITIYYNAKEFQKEFMNLTSAIVIVMAISSFVSSLALLLLIRKFVVSPIKFIEKLSQQLSFGDVEIDPETDSKLKQLCEKSDELGSLSRAFAYLLFSFKEKAKIAENIANGILEIDVEVQSEKDVLGKAVKSMASKLNNVFSLIESSTEQIYLNTNDISSVNYSLAKDAADSAMLIQDISSSISEITSQTQATAEHTERLREVANVCYTIANSGSRHMTDMMEAMTIISTASQQIAKIIKAIDDISFQTNLLAINAAVEAARAGKYGKGFSVVAEEFRNLANKAALAAKETASIIADSTNKVDNGFKIATTTVTSFNELVSNINKETTFINEISAASHGQSEGILMINSKLSSVDKVTKQNAAYAKNTAAATEKLLAQVLDLQSVFVQFAVKKRKTGASSNPPTNSQFPFETK